MAAHRGKMHGRKSVQLQDLAMARREFGELTRFDCIRFSMLVMAWVHADTNNTVVVIATVHSCMNMVLNTAVSCDYTHFRVVTQYFLFLW